MMRVMESTEGGMNAASSRSRKMLGSENATSVKRMKIRSIAPPRYAAMVPIAVPTTALTSIAANPTVREIRPAWINRLR